MFSPWYALARRRGGGDPFDHCALNCALYGTTARRWTMTERGRGSLERDTDHLAIGPSSLAWAGDGLTIEVAEVAAPLPRRVRGTIRVRPPATTRHRIALDPAGLHRWWPIAPQVRVEAEFSEPALRWSGTGYFDTNDGDGPLEETFTIWDWCRAGLRDATAILYNPDYRAGGSRVIALRIDGRGAVEPFEAPPPATLPPTFWRVGRRTRADAPPGATVRETLTDTPFYSRSVLDTHILGEPATAVHESLSLDRFAAPWVQLMLPFRVPRRRG